MLARFQLVMKEFMGGMDMVHEMMMVTESLILPWQMIL